MCGLCGILGVAEHWTDSAGGAPGATASRQADRQHRARIANAVLGVFGLKLSDWMNRYTLTGPTGRSAVIDNLGAVWPMAERLTGRPCDPLDPAVIAAIEARDGADRGQPG